MLPSEENPMFSIFIPKSFTSLFFPHSKNHPNPFYHKKIPGDLRKYAARISVQLTISSTLISLPNLFYIRMLMPLGFQCYNLVPSK